MIHEQCSDELKYPLSVSLAIPVGYSSDCYSSIPVFRLIYGPWVHHFLTISHHYTIMTPHNPQLTASGEEVQSCPAVLWSFYYH